MNHYEMVAQITVNYWSLHRWSSSSQIMGWVRLVMTKLSNKRILLEGNKLKVNFYTVKSMLNSFGLRYQNINMCPNFNMLCYLENTKLTKCKTYRHVCYKPKTGRRRILPTHRKHRYFLITPRLERLFMSPKTTEHMT
jgi:hypothetical protein